MSKKNIIKYLIAAALFILLVFIIALAPQSKTSWKQQQRKELLTLTGLNTKFSTELEAGKPVLLDFFTTWCRYCVVGIPHLKQMYKEIQAVSANFQILAIDIGESPAKVKAFVKKHKIPYRVVIDPYQKLADKYKIRGVPTYIVLDKKRKVVYRGHTLPDWRKYR